MKRKAGDAYSTRQQCFPKTALQGAGGKPAPIKGETGKDVYGKKGGKQILRDLIAFPSKNYIRRTDDGYPFEIIYDEFAYKRIVNFYRTHIKAALKRLGKK